MAERLGRLKNLEHLVYSSMSEDEAEADRSAVLEHGEQWNETVKHFEEHCPSLRYMQLCKQISFFIQSKSNTQLVADSMKWKKLTAGSPVIWG